MRLFEPFKIKNMILPNRVVLTAMVTRLSGEDGFINKDIEDRYLRFAQGEPGLIVLEAMAIHSYKSGQLLRISDDNFIPGLRDLAKKIHDTSPCKVAPQIIHFLKIARSGWRQKIQDLTKEDIKLIVDQYGDAAYRAREAGYDAVELHMAHAYTLSSFLSLRNRREDEYGGTLENRMRAMSEVIVKCREKVGKDFPIGVRYDGEECITDGYGLNDSREIALRMAKLGIDWISISAGGKFEDAVHKPGEPLYPYTGYSGDRCMPSAVYQDGYNLYLPAGIRQYIYEKGLSTPVIATGKIRTPEMAEEILQTGRADLIGFARTLLADPDWPRKVRDGHADKIVPCISINVCKSLDENFKKVRCFLWPKDHLHAPHSSDTAAPQWPKGGAGLKLVEKAGRVRLSWTSATDTDAVYGYEIFRSTDNGPYVHLSSIRANMHPVYQDSSATGGAAYTYFIRAYDLAGNRSAESNRVNFRYAHATVEKS